MAQALLLVLVMTVLVVTSEAIPVAEKHKSVLLLFSEESNLPSQAMVEQSLRSTLKNGSPVPLEVYSEYLDFMRTPVNDYENELVGLLRRKYEGRKFDLIITFAPSALRMLLKNQPEIFPDTPIVFQVLDQRNVADLNLGPNVTGVWGEINFKPNLDLALALHPKTRKVVVLAGVSEFDKYWTARVQEDFLAYEGRLEITYLIGRTIAEQQQALASLPQHTIVFFVSATRDNAGNNYHNPDVLSQISSASSAPIYGTTDAQLGRGIVGGSIVSFEAFGVQTAGLGLRILAGEKPQAIAPHGVPNLVMFDWRELRRWGISEQNLPPGSIVRFKEPTLWEQYKWHIVGIISLCILEALLIVLLLISRAKRRQAQREARDQHRRLDEVVSNVPGLVWEICIDPDSGKHETRFVSGYVDQMLGYRPEEFIETSGFGMSLIPEEDRATVEREINQILTSGTSGAIQFRWQTKDRGLVWVESHLTAIRDENHKTIGLRGVTMNISDRRQAEIALQENQAQLAGIIGSAMDAIISIDDRQRVVLFNAAAEAMFGCSAAQALGQPFNTFIPNPFRDTQDHFSALKQANGGRPQMGSFASFSGKRAGGEDFPVDLSISEVELNGARFYTIILRDITERMRAEEALRESEHRFQLVSQTTKDILYEWNLQTDFVWWNDSAMYSVFGYPLEEMRHDVNWWEERLHPEDKDRIDVSVSEALGGVEQMWENEYRFRKMDNSYAYVYHRAFIVRGDGGKALRVIGSLMDFTERKQSEEKLRSALGEVSQLKNQLQEENIYLQEEIKLAHDYDQIVGRSDATKYVLFKIEQVAPTDSTVLITGETGTGKELVARAIHSSSLRKDRPLVRVNCAALSPTLIESELFGHEKGAYTGATARKIGRFELANEATIFLDEIGELPLELQAKLLRVIQEGEFERLGSSKTVKVDARIIAATNRNLKIAVEQGAFREDLWYRLNVFPITVPPLRDRKEDIPVLVEHFVRRFSQKVGRRISSISPASLRILQDYTWPGNVRELANVLERAVINTNGTVLRVVDHFEKAQVELPQTNKTLEEIEKEYIMRILDNTGWRIEGHKGAARVLGLNPSTLRTRMAKLGIQKLETKILTSSV
jgi:PAS domain S-box-containing protein